ncbi:MAG: hypothetical protein K2F63_04420 [Muribaculaceae bacterium]|nr:hypothetical protein [Muribaculaceae bacterium]MDE6134211.1 hypothetical protein [Muribaculaceae bacterium]
MSRDIKGTSLTELNDGLDRAVRRCKNQLTSAIADAERSAVRSAVKISNENILKAQRETQNRIDSATRNLSSRIENTQRQLGAKIDQQSRKLADDIARLDRRHTAAIEELTDSVFDAMNAQNNYIESRISHLDKNISILDAGLKEISQGMNDLSRQTNERFARQQKEITLIQSEVKAIFDRQAADVNSRLLAAGAALALLDAVRERTDVERFAPRHMLESIALKEERLRRIGNNPDSCTITDANILIDEALVMENEAIRLRNEWESVHKSALMSALAVLKLLQTSETIKVPSLYGESEEELKADYWTHGAHRRVLNEISLLKEQIENAPADIALLKDLKAKVDILQRQAENIIIEAAELGTLSEQRVIVSNDVLEAMINQGWELKGDPDFLGGEEDCDWREGTFAVLHKPNTGEEVSILVLPEEKNGRKGNQIIFHRNDDLMESAGAFQSRMEEIKREIEKSGYKLGALHEPEHGDGKVEQLRNHDAMRRRGAAEKLKATLSRR